jgi:hypothetical protein
MIDLFALWSLAALAAQDPFKRDLLNEVLRPSVGDAMHWGGLAVRAQPGGATGTWFYPNVTSLNCSYDVPATPMGGWRGQSIFLWCGMQPGGGLGVIQPQVSDGI